MAKKTRSIESPLRPASWIVQGREYKIGEVIRVITPEFNVIDAQVAPISYYFGGNSVSLSLGWIKTPRPGIGTKNGFNAMLTYSVIGTCEEELHLVYFCNCRRNVHSEELRWRTNLINGVIRSDAIGRNHHTAYNHPLTDGYKHLLPIPHPLLIPPPIDVKLGTQFSLFH